MADAKNVNRFSEAIHNGDEAYVLASIRAAPELLQAKIALGTPLHYAASAGRLNIVKLLVEHKLDINAPAFNSRYRPLHKACNEGHLEVARWLIDHGADVNAGEKENFATPIIGPVIAGDGQMVRLLIERGANVNATYGIPPKNALGFAMSYGHKTIEQMLRSRGAEEPGSPTKAGQPDAVSEIVDYLRSHLGPIDPVSHHEIIPGGIPIAVHSNSVNTTPPPPCRALFTTGMSDLSMKVPVGFDAPTHVELLMYLPTEWPLDPTAMTSPRFNWPAIWLRRLAREIHDTTGYVPGWMIVSTAEPPRPVCDGTQLCCFLLIESQELGRLELADGRKVGFIDVTLIHKGERDLALSHGLTELLGRFKEYSIGMVLDLSRPDVSLT